MSFRHQVWTEKYRPKSLDEVVGNKPIISTLRSFLDEQNIPHLFFSGRAGVGKTSAIQAFSCDLYGRDYEELQRLGLVLESNASTLNRLPDIRDSKTGEPAPIKRFMMSAVPLGEPFKILILDEAERLTDPAQHAMRRLMELYNRTCKVCIICNQPEKIIAYLRSRCSVFNFNPLQDEDVKSCLNRIAASENLIMEKSCLEAILSVSKGDLRKAINILQMAANKTKGTIDAEYIYNIQSGIQSDKVRELINMSINGEFVNAKEVLEELLETQVPRTEILKEISNKIHVLDICNKIKTKLLDEVARTDYLITQSKNIDLQLTSLLARMVTIGKELK